MNISSNLTLEILDKPFLLEKRIELLFAIKEEGSISKAAKRVPMSYKSAWDAVDAMNNLSHTPIVLRETGGKGGGGTVLTPYGENLLKTYKVLKKEQQRFLETLNNMTDIDTGSLKTIGRLAMQISARNQLTGSVEMIDIGGVNSQIYIKLKSGYILVSVITNSATEMLDLKIGDEVTAIFKSSSVLVTTDTALNISARNRLKGSIDTINLGQVNAELIIDIGLGDKIASVITANSVSSLGLKVGSEVSGVIKSSDVMIGK